MKDIFKLNIGYQIIKRIRHVYLVQISYTASGIKLEVIDSHSVGITCPGSSDCEHVFPSNSRQHELEGMQIFVCCNHVDDLDPVPVSHHAARF